MEGYLGNRFDGVLVAAYVGGILRLLVGCGGTVCGESAEGLLDRRFDGDVVCGICSGHSVITCRVWWESLWEPVEDVLDRQFNEDLVCSVCRRHSVIHYRDVAGEFVESLWNVFLGQVSMRMLVAAHVGAF